MYFEAYEKRELSYLTKRNYCKKTIDEKRKLLIESVEVVIGKSEENYKSVWVMYLAVKQVLS